jgi:hypothetical protein
MQNELTIPNSGPPMPLTESAQRSITAKTGMSERQWANYYAVVSVELFKLRTAYPTQARNYSDRETDALTALWLEIFAGIELEVLHEAVVRFIAADRKAFFPSPGQVMGHVDEIHAEIEAEKRRVAHEQHMAELRETQRLIDAGERCENCVFVRYEEQKAGYGYPPGTTKTVKFCTNPESYYSGDTWGTVIDRRCDLFTKNERNDESATI